MLCQAARVHSQWGKLQLDYCQETCTFNVPHDAFSWRQRANGNWAGRLSDQPPLLSVFLLKNIFNWKFQRLFHPLKNPFKKSNIRLLEPITHTEPSKVKWIDGPLSIYPPKTSPGRMGFPFAHGYVLFCALFCANTNPRVFWGGAHPPHFIEWLPCFHVAWALSSYVNVKNLLILGPPVVQLQEHGALSL